MSNVKNIVEEAIENNAVVIFSKSYCPYCKKAKALFDSLNVKYYSIELDTHELGGEIQNYLLEKTGQRTVPNVFVAKQHIGGSDDLQKANDDGKLQTLLSSI
ncbi:unnamed protein product [Mucor hiemalis]